MTEAPVAAPPSAAAPVASSRRLVRLLAAACAVMIVVLAVAAQVSPASAQTSTSKDEAIKQLDSVRATVDQTIALLDAGNRDAAFEQAVTGYLEHFELVEIPLRVADPDLTVQAEGVFAETRQLIKNGASTSEVRAKLIELRGLLDESERRLTDVGIGAPSLVFGQAFLIIFREGLEVVLLLAVLLGYLENSKAGAYRRPVLGGVALAVVATVLTFFAFSTVLSKLTVGRELLEAFTSLAAVAVLFWVSFWLLQRLDHKRWMEFLKARVWRAVSVGSTVSLVLLGFTAVYREGFESVLFYQALLSFGTGLGGYVLAGLLAGAVALAAVTFVIFRLGRKLPVGTFLKIAVILVMATSIAFLGNAIHSMQEAFLVPRTPVDVGRLPIFLAQATGVWPTTQTLVAQATLLGIYVLGAVYMFVIKPRRDARPRTGGSTRRSSGSARPSRPSDASSGSPVSSGTSVLSAATAATSVSSSAPPEDADIAAAPEPARTQA